eukprot:scaffold51435_cov63-Attheya_sp.AAC.4
MIADQQYVHVVYNQSIKLSLTFLRISFVVVPQRAHLEHDKMDCVEARDNEDGMTMTIKDLKYCVEARDNEDDMTMLTIKDLRFDLLCHARNKPTQGSLHMQWSNL